MPQYHVSIFGGGSVGLCLAAHFVKAGAEVTLLVRQASLEALEGQPITVSGLLGDHVVPPGVIQLCDAARPSDAVLKSDMLILTTKAYDVASALGPFAGQSHCPPVLLLQNGMGSAEIARDVLGLSVPVFSTAMMIGMVRTALGHVEVTAQSSPILCGPLLGEGLGPLEQMLDIAQAGFVPMAHDPAIRDTISFKLLFNSCMNPTGALTGQTYGALLHDPDARAFITGLADETLAAYAAAYDYRPANSGQHYVDDVLSPIIFPRAQGHRSSMLQDMNAGRKTEVDFLNGAIIRLAEGAGLECVRHRSVLQLVRARQATSDDRL